MDPKVNPAITSSLRPGQQARQQARQQERRRLCSLQQARQLRQVQRRGQERRQGPGLLFYRKRPEQRPTRRPESKSFSCQFLDNHDVDVPALVMRNFAIL